MENSEMSTYVNLSFGGEIDEHMVMSGEMDMPMAHYINEAERHDGQSLGGLGDDNAIENGNGFAVEAYIQFDDFVHASDTMSDGQQMLWNIGTTSDNQMAAEGWDPSSLAIHDSVQTAQENNPQTVLMNPDAATQFLIDPALSSPPTTTESKKSQRPSLLQKPTQLNGSNKTAPPIIKPGAMNNRLLTATGQNPAINKLPSPQLRKIPVPPRKTSSGNSNDSTAKVRNLCMEKFHNLFTKKYMELEKKAELPDSQEGPEQLAHRLAKRIEESIYDNFASKTERDGLGQSYKSKFRNLLTSLGHPKNEDLLMQVVKGDIPPVRLVMMSAEDLANPEQKSLMVKVRRESMQQSVLKAEDINGPRIKKTHKGEFIIVEVGRDSPKHDAPDTNSTVTSTHPTFNTPNVRPKINVEDLIPKRRTSATDGTNSANSENSSKDDLFYRSVDETSTSTNSFSQITPQNDDSWNNTKGGGNDVVMNNAEVTGSPVAMSVGSSVNSPPLSPQAKSIISPTMSPSNTPTEEPPSNPVIKLPPIWKGRLLYDGVARFSGHATLVAAKKRDRERNWEEFLAASIRCNGHVSRVEQADTYLIDCWCSPSKDVAFIKFEANEDEANDKEQFDLIFNYLRYSPKDRVVRYGRVANAYSTVREMYLIPLEPEDKVPDVITFLDHDEIFMTKNNEKRESKLLLGAIVIIDVVSSKSKRPRDLTQNISRPMKKEKLESSTVATTVPTTIATTAVTNQSNIRNSPLVGNAVVQSPIVAPQNIASTIIAPPVNSPPNQQAPTNLPAVTTAQNGILPGLLQTLLAQSNSTVPNQTAPPTVPFPHPPPQFNGPPAQPGLPQLPPQAQMPPGFPLQYEQFYQHLPPPNFPQQGPPPQQPPVGPPQAPPPQPQTLPPYGPPPNNEYVHFQPPPSDNRRPPGTQDFRPKWGPPPENRPPWDQAQWEQEDRRNWNQNDSRPPREREYRRGPSPPHSDYRDRKHRGHSHNRDLRGRRGNNSPRGGRNINVTAGQSNDRDWNDHDRNDWGERDRDDRDDGRYERNNREHHYNETTDRMNDRGGKSRRGGGGGRFRGTRA
ncbi:4119_t:CDS:2 [Acaulospora colombiana]|uniref:4119_t:CDS:1 n=1 Tax=Acaulospora colombiana TaxID=27376 RepID=A0ACA9KCV5_9GLOM|nr:4119_t:CDS:2 [Acaulospora colombiana]